MARKRKKRLPKLRNFVAAAHSKRGSAGGGPHQDKRSGKRTEQKVEKREEEELREELNAPSDE